MATRFYGLNDCRETNGRKNTARSNQVKITWCEARVVIFVIKARRRWHKRHATNEQAQSKINEYESLAAEYAFCKLHNLFPDLGWRDLNEQDCEWGGYPVDVKCVKGGYMSIRWNEKKQANDPTLMYCGMRRVSKAKFEYLGFVQHAEVEKVGEKRPNKSGAGFYYSVPVDLLQFDRKRLIAF